MRLPRAGLVIALLVWGLAGSAAGVSLSMEGGVFRTVGWQPPEQPPSGGWGTVLSVYAGSRDAPPMLGAYRVENGSLVFQPRFPISPGMLVTAVLKLPDGTQHTAIYRTPRADAAPRTRVDHIYPSSHVLPSNQLKFYVHFSAPMQRGSAWDHIRLLGEDGRPVDLPFLEIDQELWDRDLRRLTILFDPGRIKRGVLPLEEVGAALEEGRSYTLVVSRDWPDANGLPLVEEYRKVFRVGPAVRSPIEPAHWRLGAPPRAGRSDSLVLDFDRPMDYALLKRLLTVEGPEGPVAGQVATDRNEMRWIFVPAEPWKTGQYRVVVDTALEDVAGNRIGREFDVDVFDRVTRRVERETIELPFRIGHQ